MDRFKKPTKDGSGNRPVDRFKKQTKRKPREKDTDKQQAAPIAVMENVDTYRFLIEVGFDERTAMTLSQNRGVAEIQRQIDWLPYRNPEKNPKGLLRRAIEEHWSEPAEAKEHRTRRELAQREQEETALTQARDAQVQRAKLELRRRKQKMVPVWERFSQDEQAGIERSAYERLKSDFERKRFRTKGDYRLQKCLDELLLSQNAPSSIPES